MRKPEKTEEAPKAAENGGTCGAQHGDCPQAWKGSCDREAGHDGSHHCSACNSLY